MIHHFVVPLESILLGSENSSTGDRLLLTDYIHRFAKLFKEKNKLIVREHQKGGGERSFGSWLRSGSSIHTCRLEAPLLAA